MSENNQPSKNNSIIMKATVISLVAGMLGGGAAYLGLSQVYTGPSTPQVGNVSNQAEISKSAAKNAGPMTPAFEKVKNTVVSVINLQKQKTNRSGGVYGLFGGDSSDQGNNSKGKLETYSEGSGLIYMKNNGKGYIVTNNHVVSGSDELQVVLSDGQTIDAKLVGADAETDLAVLSIDGRYVTQTAQFGNSKNLIPGEQVIAVGSPLGSQYATTVTQGIVSAASRTIDITNDNGQTTGQATVVQTDAAINPGNSGGPLVNSSGQVIGINSMKLAQGPEGVAVEGMGFAIPSDEVVTIINQLVKNGKINRPKLGVMVIGLDELTDYGRKKLKVPNDLKSGVYVDSVNKGGSAQAAGMKDHDIITKIDGKKVDGVVSLHQILYSHKIGDQVQVTVVRAGKQVNLTIKLQ